MKKAIQIALVSFAITAGLIKAAPALAEQPAGDTAVSIVRTADLDLASDSGRRQLDSRLANAVREVSGDASAERSLRSCAPRRPSRPGR